jgi:hypothetical protein
VLGSAWLRIDMAADVDVDDVGGGDSCTAPRQSRRGDLETYQRGGGEGVPQLREMMARINACSTSVRA